MVWGPREVDLRSLEFHNAVALKLKENTRLLTIAIENMDRWERLGYSVQSKPLREKWKKLINGPLEALIERMVEDSEEMQELRSASPFAGILSDEERMEVIRKTSRN